MFAVADRIPPSPPPPEAATPPSPPPSPVARTRVSRREAGGRRGVKNFCGPAPLARTPTTAAPGTPEKLEVMEQRAAGGFAIFHPEDARYPGDPRPVAFLATRSERTRRGVARPAVDRAACGRRGVGNVAGDGPAAMAPHPTGEEPGSAAKLAEMHKRAVAGFSVFHPEDAVPDLQRRDAARMAFLEKFAA